MGEIEDEAEARHLRHINHPTHRPLSDGYELVGLTGEDVFCRIFGQSVDLIPRPGGDRGADCFLWCRLDDDSWHQFAVDVKTARKAFNLIVEVGKVVPNTIYVLASYREDGSAVLLGWEWGRTLLRSEPRDFGKGVINHWIPRDRLRSMSELKSRAMVV